MANSEYSDFAYSGFFANDDENEKNYIGPENVNPDDVVHLCTEVTLEWTHFLAMNMNVDPPELIAYGRIIDYGADIEDIVNEMRCTFSEDVSHVMFGEQ